MPCSADFSATREPDWAPLERFVSLLDRLDPRLSCSDFMWMGSVQRGPVLIHQYKHIDTRRYLMLDPTGHAWQYHGPTGTYGAHKDPRAAIEHALADLDLIRGDA